MELQPVHDRIEIFERKLKFQQLSLPDLLAEVRALRETFEAGLRFKIFLSLSGGQRPDVREIFGNLESRD